MAADATVYIVKIAQQDASKGNTFLALTKTSSGVEFTGMYNASSITDVESLFKTKTLSAKDSRYARSLNGATSESITLNDKVRQLILKALPKKKKVGTDAITGSSSIRRGVNLEYGGEPGCIEYWWWIFEPELGEWIPLYYLYTVCDGGGDNPGGGGGGSSGGTEEEDLSAMYEQEIEEYADGSEQGGNYSTGTSAADGTDPIMGTHTWTVGKHNLGSWSVVANTKYAYYHTEYYDINLSRMVQNYNATYYKTEAINYIGSNFLITSKWTTTTLSDQVLSNNSEDAKGKTQVTGVLNHEMHVKVKASGIEIDKVFSSVTSINGVQLELKFN